MSDNSLFLSTINGGIGMIDGFIGTVRQAIGERHCITIHSASRLVCIYGYYDTSLVSNRHIPVNGVEESAVSPEKSRSMPPCLKQW